MQPPILVGIFIIILGICAVLAFMVLSHNSHKKDDTIPLNQLLGRFQEFSERHQQDMIQLKDKLNTQEKQMADRLHQQASQGQQVMGEVKERLAKIITAQERIDSLSDSVIDLKQVLDNKQRRGQYGEMRLVDQIKDYLPPSAYKFQAKLSNDKVADCLLTLPGHAHNLVIDAKFPLEHYRHLSNSQTEADIAQNRKAFANSVLKHVHDIADKYLIPGETADIAVMYIPSESIYMDIHDEMLDLVEKAVKRRVYFVSPITLMALLNTIQAVLKDAHMREEAVKIRAEVMKIGDNIHRLEDRVGKLAKSHQNMGSAIHEIQTSTQKITRHADNIQNLGLGEEDDDALPDLSHSLEHQHDT